jgi:hypothetical protein
MNARHLTDSIMLDLMANAACVAYAFSGNFTFAKVYTETGEAEELTESDEEEETAGKDISEEILKSKDPTKWCMLLKSCKGSLPMKVKNFMRRAVEQIDEPRDGTIDKLSNSTSGGLPYCRFIDQIKSWTDLSLPELMRRAENRRHGVG